MTGLLLDLVLGYNAHPDLAGATLEAVMEPLFGGNLAVPPVSVKPIWDQTEEGARKYRAPMIYCSALFTF